VQAVSRSAIALVRPCTCGLPPQLGDYLYAPCWCDMQVDRPRLKHSRSVHCWHLLHVVLVALPPLWEWPAECVHPVPGSAASLPVIGDPPYRVGYCNDHGLQIVDQTCM
jgi:hypothetical protein